MKVLLSNYECRPNRGSEPGIGWNWALEAASLGHEVWALTRDNNRSLIEMELAKSPPIRNLCFLYYDLPWWARWRGKGNRGLYLHYLLWQWGAYLLAKKVHETKRFDQVHHVTFGSLRLPSFMGNLGIPFVFGPVAGGERAPWCLRAGYGVRGWSKDAIRDLSNILVRRDPMVCRTFKLAERIYVTSEQTLALLPPKYRQKASVQLAIGFNSGELPRLPEQRAPGPVKNGRFRILYVGRLLYWKGMHLGLPAFARLVNERPEARLTIVGSGPDEQRWRTLAEKLGLGNRIEWIPLLERKELSALYASHDVFLFPSLHDSGGTVILEAMTYGLPIVCLNLGGPGQIVDKTCGFKIETAGLSKERTIFALADCMIKLAGDSLLLSRLSGEAVKRAKNFSWSALVVQIFTETNGSG